MKNSLNQNLNQNTQENIKWKLIQEDFKTKFGKEVFESWLKKMSLLEINSDNLKISVPTRFIRDWIVSRYLDQILGTIKKFNKEIVRVEFKIDNKIGNDNIDNKKNLDAKISFIKDSFLQYNRIDQNKTFDNFVIGFVM